MWGNIVEKESAKRMGYPLRDKVDFSRGNQAWLS